MSDCIFCKIANGEIPTEFLYEDENVVAFNDLNPQAPVHVLVVPKDHHDNFVDDVPAETLASMETAVRAVAERCGVAESGFRFSYSFFHFGIFPGFFFIMYSYIFQYLRINLHFSCQSTERNFLFNNNLHKFKRSQNSVSGSGMF